MSVFGILTAFVALIYLLIVAARRGLTLGLRSLFALLAGAAFGVTLQLLFGEGSTSIDDALDWINILGTGYVSLLKMIVMPLILVSITAAVVRAEEISLLGKFGGMIVGLLVGTTVIAAFIGVLVSSLFGLSSEGLIEGTRELARAEQLQLRQGRVTDLGLPQTLLTFIPQNIFSDLAGTRPSSIIAVVLFAALLGVSGLLVTRDHPEHGRAFRFAVEVAQDVVLKLVRLVIALTPYGVLALAVKVAAVSNATDILNLVSFIFASYLAILLMFLVHGGMLLLSGVNVLKYFRAVWPVLVFAFTSRSSAATIPLNIETQVKALGNQPTVANFSASLGATIGQNGCAGIYPAMLVVMIAPSVGVDPLEPVFLITMLSVIAISSFGVAGVGGGATFAALMVLPALGLPIALVALLISIEPLIDMARTALNVNGAMTAGTLTQRWLKPGDRGRVFEEGAEEGAEGRPL